jgi:hypothetical protein
LIDLGRAESPILVLAATWNHIDGAKHVAEKVDAPLIVVPASSGAVDEAPGYSDLFEFICASLEKSGSDGS